MAGRDTATNQMKDFLESKKNEAVPSATTSAGAPIGFKTASLTAGPRGPILLQDHVLIDETAHFDRERIPERVVHAKGAGKYYTNSSHNPLLLKCCVFYRCFWSF